MNGALPSKRTLEFAGLSQVVHVLTSQYGFTCYKDEECSLLLPLNRQKQQPVNREGWVSEVVHMLITTSSIWEFQLVHQTWNTKIINSLSFNFFILPSLLLLIMFFLSHILHDYSQTEVGFQCKNSWQQQIGNAGKQRWIAQAYQLHTRGIEELKCHCFRGRGWAMWFWSLSLPHFRRQNIADISISKDTCIMSPVNWLETSLCGKLFDVSSAEILFRLRRIAMLLVQMHQDSAFHSMDKKMEIWVVDSYCRKVSKGYQAHLTGKVKVWGQLLHSSVQKLEFVPSKWPSIDRKNKTESVKC